MADCRAFSNVSDPPMIAPMFHGWAETGRADKGADSAPLPVQQLGS